MSCVVTHNGKRCLALISCHLNGEFSYYENDRWVTARTVPSGILWASDMPDEERYRVIRKMDELGVDPS